MTVANGETDAHNYFKETIACTNEVTNIDDDGPGSLRYVIECAEEGDTITFNPSLINQAIHLTSSRIILNKDLHIHSSLVPRIMIYSDIPGAFLVEAGKTIEMKNIEITSGITGELGAAIENYGHLTLWDVCVFRNPLLPEGEYLIYNGGAAQLMIQGSCHFEMD